MEQMQIKKIRKVTRHYILHVRIEIVIQQNI